MKKVDSQSGNSSLRLIVPEGRNVNSRGRQPTVACQEQIRPRRGRTAFPPLSVGCTHGYSYLAAPRPFRIGHGQVDGRASRNRDSAAEPLECGDSSPLFAGDLSPSQGVARTISQKRSARMVCPAAQRGAAWTTSRPSGKSGDKSPHSTALLARFAEQHLEVCNTEVVSRKTTRTNQHWKI